jgi:hypothetical protein
MSVSVVSPKLRLTSEGSSVACGLGAFETPIHEENPDDYLDFGIITVGGIARQTNDRGRSRKFCDVICLRCVRNCAEHGSRVRLGFDLGRIRLRYCFRSIAEHPIYVL